MEDHALKISVLTPSFNSADYIGRAIDSVLQQGYANVEHIVVDGGSTDSTVDILKKYPHLRWISEKDQGQTDAMNNAFNLSTGDIIVYLNADDFFNEHIFETVVKAFNKDRQVDMVVGDVIEDINGTIYPMDFKTGYKKNILHFKNGFPFNPVCYFYKRKVQEVVGPFSLDEHYAMDYWFILEAFRKFSFVKIPTVFGVFFKHVENKTSNSDNFENCKKVALAHCAKYDRRLLYFYKWNLFLHTMAQQVPKIKYPFKMLYYYLFLSRKIDKQQYLQLGFKKSLQLKDHK